MHLKISLDLTALNNATFSTTFYFEFNNVSNVENWYDPEENVTALEFNFNIGSLTKTMYVFLNGATTPTYDQRGDLYELADVRDQPIIFECDIPESQYDRLYEFYKLGIIDIIPSANKTVVLAFRLNSDRDHVRKDLKLVTIIEGSFKAPLGVKSFELDVISYDIDNSYNYVYIPRLKRYYYVSTPQLVTNSYTKLILQEDVLMSWKTLISQQSAYVTRYGGASNSLLVDERYPVKDEAEVDYFIPSMTTGVNVVSFKYVMDVVSGKSKPNIICKTSSEIITFLGAETNVSAPSGSGLPNIEGTKAKINKVYLLNINDYGGLVRACLLNDAPSSFIHNIMLLPFDLGDIFPSASMRNSNLLAGNKWLGSTGGVHWTSEASSDDPLFPETNMSAMPYIVVADFTFDAIGNITRTYNYLDYAPNTLWEIYIPFVGWIQLDPVQVLGKRIMIYFSLDIDTGLSTCYIYNRTDQKVVWSGSCQLGMKLSLAVTNADELARQKQATSLNLIMGVVSSMASMGIGGYMGNPVAMVGGIMGMANTVKDAVNSFNSMIERAQITYGSSDNALFSPNSIIVRKTAHKKLITTVDEESRYNSINGKPYKQYVVLSSLTSGYYIEVGDIHFDPKGENIYNVEIDEIVALLKNGVIL